jgi:hypothetical protein
MAAAMLVAGCSSDTTSSDTTSSETTGSLSLDLEVGNIDIDEVDYLITNGGEPRGGTIDVSAPGSTASVEVFGLLPGDYTVHLSATSTDGETHCEGSEDFSIDADELTEVIVYLRCKLPETLGGVRVNGEFNVCAVVKESVVKPLQTSVGNDIDLSAMGEDAEGDDITYIWSGTGGDVDDPNAMDTTYTCEEVGKHSVTIRVSDDGFEYCMDSWTTVVTCVLGDVDLCDNIECKPDGNECTVSECDPGDGICKPENVENGTDCKDGAGTCFEGECVDIDKCEDVNCDDDNQCTDNSCNTDTGECINDPIREGEECNGGDGMCVEGDCIAVDKCEGVTCDDTGNECTVGVCNMQTGACDPMDVQDGTECNAGAGACSAGECIDGNMCDDVNCSDGNQCTVDPICDPADGVCKGGSNETINTACDQDGGTVCDGEGNCVQCNSADQCAEDTNDCTEASCAAGACGQADLSDGTMCDFGGADGVCMSGMCEAAPECTSPGQCDDGNDCTSNDCVGGSCEFIPTDGATCEVSTGVPGTCDAAGACIGLCEGQECTSSNQCVDDGTCEPADGSCIPGDDKTADTGCTQDGGSVCDGQGNCVECNSGGQCDEDTNECTAASCVDGECGQADVSDGTMCDAGNGSCQAGVCEPTGPPTYDLSQSVFRPYNSLLSSNPPCMTPDLSGNPGANLTGISDKCLILAPPDISGSMTFDETSAGNFDVTGTQNLSFVIDVTVVAVSAQVIIETESVTSFSGTATGALPGTLTMNPLTAPFNVNAAATGNVNCKAFNTTTMTDVSCAICPLANLTCGDNSVPLPGDPGARTFPPLTIGATSFELAAGPDDASGWYLSNPAPLAGNGTQWVALAGVLQ